MHPWMDGWKESEACLFFVRPGTQIITKKLHDTHIGQSNTGRNSSKGNTTKHTGNTVRKHKLAGGAGTARALQARATHLHTRPPDPT